MKRYCVVSLIILGLSVLGSCSKQNDNKEIEESGSGSKELVEIDEEGFLRIDNERVFPLGFFMGGSKEDDLKNISEAGFNTILSYNYGESRDYKDFLERANRNNLKVIYSLKDFYSGLNGRQGDQPKLAKTYVNELKGRSGLLSWYINDELGPSWLRSIQDMYKMVQSEDPSHPCFQVLNLPDKNSLRAFNSSTDILGVDVYPVGQEDLTQTSRVIRNAVEATEGKNNVWGVLQAHNNGVYGEDIPDRIPTLDEMRNQAYQAIINGAKGILFYSYFDLRYETYPKEFNTVNMDLFRSRWNDLSKVGKEISDDLAPIIMGGEKIDLIKEEDGNGIEVAGWDLGTVLSILVANPYYYERSITIDIPEGWELPESSNEDVELSSEGNKKLEIGLGEVACGTIRLTKK